MVEISMDTLTPAPRPIELQKTRSKKGLEEARA